VSTLPKKMSLQNSDAVELYAAAALREGIYSTVIGKR